MQPSSSNTQRVGLRARIRQHPTFMRGDSQRWVAFLTRFLKRLELKDQDRDDAIAEYALLSRHIADRLALPHTDVHVFPQGSMRTQTTVRPIGNTNFDLDVVVKITSPWALYRDAETFFQAVGAALDGRESVTGIRVPKRRCWRLPYPGRPYYVDVTPARGKSMTEDEPVQVRNPGGQWSESNPIGFAQHFERVAALRFPFARPAAQPGQVDLRSQVDPVPTEDVSVMDVLRRGVQLMKVNRDHYYRTSSEQAREAQPISAVIMTTATASFEHLHTTRRHEMTNPIDLLLEFVDLMPNFILRDAQGNYLVCNPAHPAENFADRWNSDRGARAREFRVWHQQLADTLEALLTSDYSADDKEALSGAFGPDAVEIWRDLTGTPKRQDLLQGILATAGVNPQRSLPIGRRTDTLG